MTQRPYIHSSDITASIIINKQSVFYDCSTAVTYTLTGHSFNILIQPIVKLQIPAWLPTHLAITQIKMWLSQKTQRQLTVE